MINDNPVVLFHADCQDGFTAAWVAHHAMKGRDPYFVPVQYGSPPPAEAFAGHAVYILDFSYDADTIERLVGLSRALVVLDHHATAKADLEPLAKKYGINACHAHIHFDLTKSGARLAWEHFHQREPNNPPLLVKYVEDRDLWRWGLPRSREVSAWLASFPRTFEAWDEAHAFLEESGPDAAAREGAAILRYQDRVVENHVKNAVETEIAGHKVLCCNCTTLISEVAGKLAEGMPFGCTFFLDKDGRKVYSLRSRQGGLDVSKIARSLGGGGHPNAAGFTEARRP